jgi:hypothetical protein
MARGLLMQPTLIARLEHALVPARDASVVSAMAEIMMRPCFAPLERMSLETRRGRNMHHTRPSAEVIQAYLCDPRCDVVDMDSGRQGDLIAAARLPTGLTLEPDYWVAFPAPLESHIIVPHDPGLARARIDAFCDLAVAVQAAAGCVSMENGFRMALRVGFGNSTQPAKLANMQPGLTLRRLAERNSYDKCKLDREVPSPEWGLFLSRGHLETAPASSLEASGVFHRVLRLSDELVFLQLTADPADALRPDFDALLDPVRRVLAPVLSPLPEPPDSSVICT